MAANPTPARYIAVDANGNPINPGLAYMGGDDAVFGAATPGDVQRAQQEGWKQAGLVAGIGAAGSLAQLGLTAIDTPQDTYNKKRLAELETSRKGLADDERAAFEDTLLNPVRAMATESRARTEAGIAASGGASVADLTRARRESERRVNEASVAAGTQIARADIEAAARQRQEEEERRSYESTRKRQRIEMIGQTLSGLAKEMGPVLAAQAVKQAPTDAQFASMAGAKRADGTPVYPGLQGRSVGEIRALWVAEMKEGTGKDGSVFAGTAVAPAAPVPVAVTPAAGAAPVSYSTRPSTSRSAY